MLLKRASKMRRIIIANIYLYFCMVFITANAIQGREFTSVRSIRYSKNVPQSVYSSTKETDPKNNVISLACATFSDEGCDIACNIKCELNGCQGTGTCTDQMQCKCTENYHMLTRDVSGDEFRTLSFDELWQYHFANSAVSSKLKNRIANNPEMRQNALRLLQNSQNTGVDVIMKLLQRYPELDDLRYLQTNAHGIKDNLALNGAPQYDNIGTYLQNMLAQIHNKKQKKLQNIRYRRQLRKILRNIKNDQDLQYLLRLLRMSGNKDLYTYVEAYLNRRKKMPQGGPNQGSNQFGNLGQNAGMPLNNNELIELAVATYLMNLEDKMYGNPDLSELNDLDFGNSPISKTDQQAIPKRMTQEQLLSKPEQFSLPNPNQMEPAKSNIQTSLYPTHNQNVDSNMYSQPTYMEAIMKQGIPNTKQQYPPTVQNAIPQNNGQFLPYTNQLMPSDVVTKTALKPYSYDEDETDKIPNYIYMPPFNKETIQKQLKPQNSVTGQYAPINMIPNQSKQQPFGNQMTDAEMFDYIPKQYIYHTNIPIRKEINGNMPLQYDHIPEQIQPKMRNMKMESKPIKTEIKNDETKSPVNEYMMGASNLKPQQYYYMYNYPVKQESNKGQLISPNVMSEQFVPQITQGQPNFIQMNDEESAEFKPNSFITTYSMPNNYYGLPNNKNIIKNQSSDTVPQKVIPKIIKNPYQKQQLDNDSTEEIKPYTINTNTPLYSNSYTSSIPFNKETYNNQLNVQPSYFPNKDSNNMSNKKLNLGKTPDSQSPEYMYNLLKDQNQSVPSNLNIEELLTAIEEKKPIPKFNNDKTNQRIPNLSNVNTYNLPINTEKIGTENKIIPSVPDSLYPTNTIQRPQFAMPQLSNSEMNTDSILETDNPNLNSTPSSNKRKARKVPSIYTASEIPSNILTDYMYNYSFNHGTMPNQLSSAPSSLSKMSESNPGQDEVDIKIKPNLSLTNADTENSLPNNDETQTYQKILTNSPNAMPRIRRKLQPIDGDASYANNQGLMINNLLNDQEIGKQNQILPQLNQKIPKIMNENQSIVEPIINENELNTNLLNLKNLNNDIKAGNMSDQIPSKLNNFSISSEQKPENKPSLNLTPGNGNILLPQGESYKISNTAVNNNLMDGTVKNTNNNEYLINDDNINLDANIKQQMLPNLTAGNISANDVKNGATKIMTEKPTIGNVNKIETPEYDYNVQIAADNTNETVKPINGFNNGIDSTKTVHIDDIANDKKQLTDIKQQVVNNNNKGLEKINDNISSKSGQILNTNNNNKQFTTSYIYVDEDGNVVDPSQLNDFVIIDDHSHEDEHYRSLSTRSPIFDNDFFNEFNKKRKKMSMKGTDNFSSFSSQPIKSSKSNSAATENITSSFVSNFSDGNPANTKSSSKKFSSSKNILSKTNNGVNETIEKGNQKEYEANSDVGVIKDINFDYHRKYSNKK